MESFLNITSDATVVSLFGSENATNESGNYCIGIQKDSVADSTISKIILGSLYTLVFILAVSGNSLVVYVVVSNRFMHNVTNMFITNLAIADLFVNFTSLWLTPTYSFMNRWIWGKALCHGAPLFQGSSLFISTLTLTAIAIDRYIVILHPFRQRVSGLVCLAVIVSIWVLSCMLTLPLAVNMKLHFYAQCHSYYCVEQWPWTELRTIYGIVVLVFQFGVPFGIIAFCYISIWYYLNRRQTIAVPSSDEQRKRRLLKMLVSMVVIFASCHISLNFLNVLRDFEISFISRSRYFTLFFLIAHLLSMSATCWNPILYAGMNENFQREFKAVLPCFPNRNRLNRACSVSRGGGGRSRVPTHTPNHDTTNMFSMTTSNSKYVSVRNHENGTEIEKNGTLIRNEEEKGLLDHKFANGSCYFMGNSASNAEIKFIPDTTVTVL